MFLSFPLYWITFSRKTTAIWRFMNEVCSFRHIIRQTKKLKPKIEMNIKIEILIWTLQMSTTFMLNTKERERMDHKTWNAWKMRKINVYKFMTFINFGNKYVQKFKHEDPTMKPTKIVYRSLKIIGMTNRNVYIYIYWEREMNMNKKEKQQKHLF